MKKDIDNYRKSQKISKEVINAINGSIKEDEAADLLSFLETNNHSSDFIRKVSDEKEFRKIYSELEEADNRKKLDLFLQKLDHHKPTKNRHLFARGAAALIVAAALLTISFVIYQQTNQSADITAAQIEKPILILSDGNQIDLEKSDKNILKNEDLVIEKNERKIKYLQQLSSSKTKMKQNRLIIPKKYSYTIVLSDGTEVCLNAGSELEYPVKFNGDIREVKLSGKAYFKVTKSTVPFVVNINNVRVKVYGTEFNINGSYDNRIETTLISGSVGVTAKGENEILIKPNQMLSIDKYTNKSIVKTVAVDNYISWKSGYFRYTDYPFTDVMNDIASWYGVQFKLSDDIKVSTMLTTLSISRNIPLDEALRFIETIMSVKILNEGGGHYSIE